MITYGTHGKDSDYMAFILEEMEANDETFYLVGSRYCGDATVESDWDFFIQGT